MPQQSLSNDLRGKRGRKNEESVSPRQGLNANFFNIRNRFKRKINRIDQVLTIGSSRKIVRVDHDVIEKGVARGFESKKCVKVLFVRSVMLRVEGLKRLKERCFVCIVQ